MIWPARTRLPTSAHSRLMRPDTSEPTLTCAPVCAIMLPVAEIVSMRSMRVATAVLTPARPVPVLCRCAHPMAARPDASITPSTIHITRRRRARALRPNPRSGRLGGRSGSDSVSPSPFQGEGWGEVSTESGLAVSNMLIITTCILRQVTGHVRRRKFRVFAGYFMEMARGRRRENACLRERCTAVSWTDSRQTTLMNRDARCAIGKHSLRGVDLTSEPPCCIVSRRLL